MARLMHLAEPEKEDVRQLPDQSPILGTTITLERLGKRGYESMSEYYQRVSPMFNEPLYTRPVQLAPN